MLHRVWDALEHGKLIRRARKTNGLRALGIVLYHLGLSLRDASMVLCFFDEASHEAVREGYSKARALFEVRRRPRRALAVDETKVRIGRDGLCPCTAIDLGSKEAVVVHLTTTRSHMDTMRFPSKRIRSCRNPPVVCVNAVRAIRGPSEGTVSRIHRGRLGRGP